MSSFHGALTLVNLQSPINIGMLLRVGEMYRRQVFISDIHNVFSSRTSRQTISDFAVGALQRLDIGWAERNDLSTLATPNGSRMLGTDSTQSAQNAFDFDWRVTDNIVLGNEYDGLGETMLTLDHVLTIPMPEGYYPKPRSYDPIDPNRSRRVANEGTPSLNVAMAGTALCAIAYNALLDAQRIPDDGGQV